MRDKDRTMVDGEIMIKQGEKVQNVSRFDTKSKQNIKGNKN